MAGEGGRGGVAAVRALSAEEPHPAWPAHSMIAIYMNLAMFVG